MGTVCQHKSHLVRFHHCSKSLLYISNYVWCSVSFCDINDGDVNNIILRLLSIPIHCDYPNMNEIDTLTNLVQHFGDIFNQSASHSKYILSECVFCGIKPL